jgi:malic enzyme
MYEYTYIKNTVAIITNGTAILGLGDIGVRAGMPVMEGKAVLFSKLVGINGIPILVDSKDIRDMHRHDRKHRPFIRRNQARRLSRTRVLRH